MTRIRRARGSRGQSLVEFSLVIPLFMLLLIAVFDLGRGVFAYNTLTNAAREGARMAIVNQYQPSLIARAKQQTAIVELNDPSVTVSFYQVNADGTPNTSTPCALSQIAVGCMATVSFEATYQPITPLIGNIIFRNGVTFTASSTLSVEYSCPANRNDGVAAANCPKQP